MMPSMDGIEFCSKIKSEWQISDIPVIILTAKLLLEDKFSVTQIAYEIGFSSPAQFTREFSKQFDCVPSKFKLKNNPQK